jgi:hypothetical protein
MGRTNKKSEQVMNCSDFLLVVVLFNSQSKTQERKIS